MRSLMLAAGLSTALALQLAGQTSPRCGSPEAPILEVRGSGQVRLPADVAVLRIQVASRASTAAAAAAETARRLAIVTDTLRHSGLGPELVEPTALNVVTNEALGDGHLVDYEARALLSVRVRQLDRLGSLVDAALAAGATEIPSVRFESDSMEAAERTALAQAFHQAETTARALAQAAGMRLGGIAGIETWGDRGGPDLGEEFETHFLRSGPTARRDVRVEATVAVRWQLGPRLP